MEKQIKSILHHMACSHHHLSRILETKKKVAHHMCQLICCIPDQQPDEENLPVVAEQSMQLTKNLCAYLFSLADLEDAIAENIGLVYKELQEAMEE